MPDQLPLFEGPALPAGVGAAPAAQDLQALAAALPANLYLGTSSWSFPGWQGLVYDRAADRRTLARHGLAAYARHPLLNAVGLDRGFHAPLDEQVYRGYARQVPDGFRFVVKAPAACTTPAWRGASGHGRGKNPRYLDPDHATRCFVEPCMAGLGRAAGPLVFQFPPQGRSIAGAPGTFAAALRRFLGALPPGPLYAVELRDAALLGEEYRSALAATGVQHCFGVHPRMPAVGRQAALLGSAAQTVTVVRWNLQAGLGYEQARERYSPFDRLLDPDPETRHAIARLCAGALRAGRAVYVSANNKAEGSAPLTLVALAREIERACPGRGDQDGSA